MSEIKHFMVDIETLGNTPVAPVITVGIQRFEVEDGILDRKESLYLEIKPDSRTFAEFGTVSWWMDQNESARTLLRRAIDKGQSEDSALNELSRFIHGLCPNKRNVRLWGNGATFDNVILDQSYRRNNITPPWSYSGHRCYRTMVNLLPEKVEVERKGNHHSATDDVGYQLDVLSKVIKQLGLKEIY